MSRVWKCAREFGRDTQNSSDHSAIKTELSIQCFSEVSLEKNQAITQSVLMMLATKSLMYMVLFTVPREHQGKVNSLRLKTLRISTNHLMSKGIKFKLTLKQSLKYAAALPIKWTSSFQSWRTWHSTSAPARRNTYASIFPLDSSILTPISPMNSKALVLTTIWTVPTWPALKQTTMTQRKKGIINIETTLFSTTQASNKKVKLIACTRTLVSREITHISAIFLRIKSTEAKISWKTV